MSFTVEVKGTAKKTMRVPSRDQRAPQSSNLGVSVIRRTLFPSAFITQRSCWPVARVLEKTIERPSGDQSGKPSSGLTSPTVSVKVNRVIREPSGRILKISGLPSFSRVLENAIQRPSGDHEGPVFPTHFGPG